MQKDVVIYGGGIVGGALALALRNTNLSLAIVEAHPPPLLRDPLIWDTRLFAVSPGSAEWLDELGIWPRDTARIQTIQKMEVWGDDQRASITFDAYDIALPGLGFIVEASLIRNAVWRLLQEQDNLEVICPAVGTDLKVNSETAQLTLSDGRQVKAKLLVGADGAESWVRNTSGLAAKSSPYNHAGIVVNLQCAKSHEGVARQWFQESGVLAWLPMPDNHISIVWAVPQAKADALMGLADADFAGVCQEAGHHSLGAMQLKSSRQAFPLKLTSVPQTVHPRLALIGDAAHNIHPLAGQGINLGFRDARVLAQILRSRPATQDCGDYLMLRRYERSRREDVLATQILTHGLQKLFGTQLPGLGFLRNQGLALTDKQTWFKTRLMRHAIS